MKRKILLFIAIVSILICALAMTVSAKHEYTELDQSALANLDVKITLTDGTTEFDATVKFTDLFNYTLTAKTESTAYALKLSGVKDTVTIGETTYTLKSSMTGIYIPDGVTHLNDNFLKQYTNLSKVCLSDSIEMLGDCVFYGCGTLSFVDENGKLDAFLPENLVQIGNNANNEGNSHFLSACTVQNDTLVFPEGITKFATQYAFNDGYKQQNGVMKLVFLGKMTLVKTNHAQSNSGFKFYFAKNSASEAHIQASGSSVERVETRLVNGTWAYAYRSAISGESLATAVDNTGKTLVININNNDPNSTASAGSYDEKDWLYQSSSAITAYFCSGEMIMTFRNGAFGWKVYRSDIIKVDNAHPFADNGVTVEPTCTIGGGTRYSCALCGSFIRLDDQTADPLGHEYTEDDLISSTPLDCLQDQTKTYKCQRCEEEFTVIIAEAPGHDMSIISTPLEATYTSLGFKRIDCASCDYFTEYEYRLDPAGATMTIVLEDGTELSVLASLIFVSTFNEESQTASITGVNTSFTYGEKTYNISDIRKIIVPFGFNHVGYQFSNSRAVEVYDFSLTKDLIIGNGAFRDNHLIEQVILGDGTSPQQDAFRAPSKLVSIVIADGATIVFPIGADPFYDNKNVQEFIIGKGANVNFAREGFKGTMNSIARIVIGDGATVNFANNSFSWLAGLKTFTIGKGCNVTFGVNSFGNNQNLAEIIIGDSSTVSFGQYSFTKPLKLTNLSVGENCTLSFGPNSFGGATALTSLAFPDSTASITFTGDAAFKECTLLESVYLPSCVASLRKQTFLNCTALKTVTLMGVTSIGDEVFKLYSSNDSILTIYSHASGNLTFPSNAFNNRTNAVLYTMSTNVTSLPTAAYTIYSGIPHAQYLDKLDPSCTENGYDGYATNCPCGNIVSNVTYTIYANDAEATTGSYGDHIILANLGGHTDKILILYANGFDASGEKSTVCGVCDEILVEAVSVKPIFVHEGYSYKLNGEITGIQSAFTVNKEELKAYEDASGKKLSFGMIIANPTYLGDTFFTNGKVNADKGAIQVQVDIGDYSVFSCYISGFQKIDPQVNLELVIAGYVYEGDDTSSLKLMQKTYEVGDEAPIVSKVTKGTDVLHTVNIANVKAPVALPSDIKEFGSQEQE
ncbi:MAG: hypothetical protein E7622_03220 [Ruminococcaceae bacterium]|nr:hypothetical protein [Oscillospiraceae bacterium]